MKKLAFILLIAGLALFGAAQFRARAKLDAKKAARVPVDLGTVTPEQAGLFSLPLDCALSACELKIKSETPKVCHVGDLDLIRDQARKLGKTTLLLTLEPASPEEKAMASFSKAIEVAELEKGIDWVVRLPEPPARAQLGLFLCFPSGGSQQCAAIAPEASRTGSREGRVLFYQSLWFVDGWLLTLHNVADASLKATQRENRRLLISRNVEEARLPSLMKTFNQSESWGQALGSLELKATGPADLVLSLPVGDPSCLPKPELPKK